MSDDPIPPEDELEHLQGGLYPVGRALRATFDAENHDSLGQDLTGLMLQLARIDPDAPAKVRLPGVDPVPPVAADAPLPQASTPLPPCTDPGCAGSVTNPMADRTPWWRRWRV